MNSTDIAKLANVSRSTVSRVINNYKNVPEETRRKVEEVIEKYGYTPNLSARTLAGKTNNIISIFIGDFEEKPTDNNFPGANSPYNAELMVRVVQACKLKGYMVLINIISKKEEFLQIEQFFKNRLIFAGIFVSFPYRMDELKKLAMKDYNIVLIDQLKFQDDQEMKINLVNSNNFLGGYEITKYFIEHGHKKIAHIKGDNKLSSIEREEGYLSALKDFNLKPDVSLIRNGEFKEETAYKVTKKMLNDNVIPTAIFVASDTMALGVARAIKELGFNIPNDISIIGFDNLKFWETLSFENQELLLNLTTMEIDMKDLTDKIIDSIFSKDKKSHKYCLPKLIERNTVLKK